VSSRSGSADVLAALGVNIEAGAERVETCLDDLGICFCFAPLLHPAMKRVAAVRKSLGVPTIFNLLGPLVNPAGAKYQLIGVGRPELRLLLADALAMLGVERATVVHGEDGLDEVTLGGTTRASVICGREIAVHQWSPEQFGLARSTLDTLLVEGPEESATKIREVFAGLPGPGRDIVLANAGAALWTAGRSESLAECVALGAAALDGGSAAMLLRRLAEYTTR
jgi:anthranilate phosphoribosyltransferase